MTALHGWQAMLATLFPPVLGLLESSDSDIALAAVPLLGSYINKLKLGLKRTNNIMPEVGLARPSAILLAPKCLSAFDIAALCHPSLGKIRIPARLLSIQ